MHPWIQEIISNPVSSLLIVGNLFLIESLLSVDNAAVLATMVTQLPPDKRKKALQYGIAGAYIFRGVCLFLATYLIRIWWLKGVGGLYLIYLFFEWLRKQGRNQKQSRRAHDHSKLYQATVGRLGNFWGTVLSVELMDMAFSMDNVFAAVAFSGNMLIILTGVFIGILAMRFVAGFFVSLMQLFPFLESAAYLVICLLGVKLSLTFYEHFNSGSVLTKVLESQAADWVTSLATIAVFFVPFLTSILFNFPSRKK